MIFSAGALNTLCCDESLSNVGLPTITTGCASKSIWKNPLYLRAEIVHPTFLVGPKKEKQEGTLRDYFTFGCWIIKLHSTFRLWKLSSVYHLLLDAFFFLHAKHLL